MKLTHAIVTDDYLCYYMTVSGCLEWVQQPIATQQLTSIAAYVDMANRYGITQLWVLPDTRLSDSFSALDDTFVTSSLDQYRVFPEELDSYLTARHQQRPGHQVTLVVPAYIKGIPASMSHLTDAKTLYACIVYLQSLLGVSFLRDAKGTGMSLLAHTNSTPQRKEFIRPVQTSMQPFYEHKTVDISWSRKLAPAETSYQYMHVVDRNVMYLAATSGLSVGSGNPVLVTQPVFSKKLAGLWKVTISPTDRTRLYDTGMLPPVYTPDSAGDIWLDTAMVLTARETGYHVLPEQAYLFPECHTTLNHWYETLRDARTALMTDTQRFRNTAARQAALDLIKMLYRQTIGLMGRVPVENERHKWYNRPDLYNAVVGEAKRRMFLTLQQFTAARIPVVAVYVDAIYFLSNQPLETCLPEGVTISDQIGKYKHVASYHLNDVAHLLTANPQTLVQHLKEVTPVAYEVTYHG